MSSWSQNTSSLRMFAHLILTSRCWLDTNWLKFALNFMAIFLQLCGLSIVSWNRGPRLGADPVPGSLLFFCFVFLNFILKLFFLFFFLVIAFFLCYTKPINSLGCICIQVFSHYPMFFLPTFLQVYPLSVGIYWYFHSVSLIVNTYCASCGNAPLIVQEVV